ncbi:MAG: flagellar hook-associated protein FlgL [Phycisphaerales bacterium]|nr:flagellar hook-associated protein FlgL [Phycisphaerales bacterium]
MAVTPINIVRVSTNMQSISLLDTLRRNTLQLFLEQNRMATGNKLNAPSEDPVLAARAMKLSQTLEQQQQILENIRGANTFLSMTDSTIGEVNDLLIQAHEIASEMVNSTADQSQRESMAQLVSGIIDQLVTIGNRMYAGRYLFGGQQTTQPPFVQESGGVIYRGDTDSLTAQIDFGQSANINLNGADLFGSLAGVVQGAVDLNPALTLETRLVDLNGVTGVSVSTGSVLITMSSPAASFQVDLTTADTIGNVIDQLNAAAETAGLTVGPGGQFNATLNAAGNGLQIDAGAGTVSILDVGQGTAARDLGIRGSGASIVGSDLDPQVTLMTSVSTLFGGAGAALGTLQIQNEATTKTIDFSGATTVQDILNTINGAGVQVKAEINAEGTGFNVVNLLSGSVMSLGEAGGNTAELLGIRSLYGQTRLSSLNEGRGVSITEGVDDFRIVAKDGLSFNVNLDGATTVQDVLDAINSAAAGAGVAVNASLAVTGNGIRLMDGTGGGDALTVERLNYSYAMDDLGLNVVMADPADTELVGKDPNGVRPDSVFSALISLYEALTTGGGNVEQAITAAGEKINQFIDSTSQWQGIVGARAKAMKNRLDFTEDAVVTTQALLSETKDLDYTEAVTRFQLAQTTLKANLMSAESMLSLSLLDFLG